MEKINLDRKHIQKSSVEMTMNKYNPVISARDDKNSISDNPESIPYMRSEEDFSYEKDLH